jgi:hypothetical protein
MSSPRSSKGLRQSRRKNLLGRLGWERALARLERKHFYRVECPPQILSNFGPHKKEQPPAQQQSLGRLWER